jgi:hypothetical protein
VNTTQMTISIDVAFYDETQREILLTYPTAAAIREIVEHGIEIPTAEFLAYYLFHRKRLGSPEYRDYNAIGRKLNVAITSLDGCIEFNGHSINTASGVHRQLNEISEHIGEAVGLSVVSRIHGLIEADWSPIPEEGGRGAARTFDYNLASDGNQFVQVENKGSSVVDNRRLSSPIYTHKHNIEEKKATLRAPDFLIMHPHVHSIRYGTISAVDPRRDGNVKCWLLDPPAEPIEDTPRRRRLLQRMSFLRDWISFISPRSQLASALSTRLADLESLQDPFELDGIPLRRGNNELFDYEPFAIYGYGYHSVFMSNKSRVVDGPAGGIVVKLSDNTLFLAGIQENLLKLATDQDFESVMAFKAESTTIRKTVECVFSKGRYSRLRLPSSYQGSVSESGGYIRLRLQGAIHYSQSGLVFGVLPLIER